MQNLGERVGHVCSIPRIEEILSCQIFGCIVAVLYQIMKKLRTLFFIVRRIISISEHGIETESFPDDLSRFIIGSLPAEIRMEIFPAIGTARVVARYRLMKVRILGRFTICKEDHKGRIIILIFLCFCSCIRFLKCVFPVRTFVRIQLPKRCIKLRFCSHPLVRQIKIMGRTVETEHSHFDSICRCLTFLAVTVKSKKPISKCLNLPFCLLNTVFTSGITILCHTR